MAKKDINRIKIVLVENKRTAKWLADELGKDPATVSKWCTNSSQPSLETLFKWQRHLMWMSALSSCRQRKATLR